MQGGCISCAADAYQRKIRLLAPRSPRERSHATAVCCAAHFVVKSQFDSFLTCLHLAAEYFRPFFQAFAPTLLNYLNELLMDITQHFLCIFLLLAIVGRKWIEKSLAFPCRDQPPF